MKIQTTISLEPELLQQLDQILANKDRHSLSDFVEDLLRNFLLRAKSTTQDARELELINQNADRLNQEAKDVLAYQVEI